MKFTVRLNITAAAFTGVVEQRDVSADSAPAAVTDVAERSGRAYGFSPAAIVNAKAERSDLPPRAAEKEKA